MFSDLVGSTALSARMDPEDLREVISAYQKCVAETVQRFGGFVAKYMGDGVLVYFGYPQAHEDDAERAVRAGLELIQAVGGLKSSAPLQTRVGIATGLVVVGDLIGSGAAQERGIVGETPNLAARLQGIAEPNTVVIAESTRKLLGNLFELAGPRSQGPQGHRRAGAGLGGVAAKLGGEPLRGAAHGDDTAGRSRRGDRAADAALGAGESWRRPGRAGLRRAGHRQVAPRCRPWWSGLPASRTPGCASSARRTTRTARSTRSSPSSNAPRASAATTPPSSGSTSWRHCWRRRPTMSARLRRCSRTCSSIPTGERYPRAQPHTAEAQGEDAGGADRAGRGAFRARAGADGVRGRALERPDHARVARPADRSRAQRCGVLVIITFRPEFTPPWIGRPHVTMLTLNRLPPRQRAEMIAHVTGGKALPKEIADQIVERTDGVPLFIEELTKTVVESGIVTDAGDHYAVTGPTAPLAIPTIAPRFAAGAA